MGLNEEILKNIDRHIGTLEKRLKEIYTLRPPSEYFNGRNEREVNVNEQIQKLEILESIYSVIDNEKVIYSRTANEYLSYLEKARKSLVILKKEKELIEQQNSAEIENIKLLLKEFKNQAENYK